METPTVRPTVRGDIEVAYLGHTVDAMIAEFMQQHDIPGLTLAIVQAPYIPRVVGYGFADPEQKRLASTRTIWPVGPISQAYAGVAVMQLYEAGQLRLDARITDLLPDLPPRGPASPCCTSCGTARACPTTATIRTLTRPEPAGPPVS